MRNVLKRTNQLAERIYTIKLPVVSWKVLFAIDGQMDAVEVANFLEMEADEVKDVIQNLEKMELIDQQEVDDSTEEIIEDSFAESQKDTVESVEQEFFEEADSEPEMEEPAAGPDDLVVEESAPVAPEQPDDSELEELTLDEEEETETTAELESTHDETEDEVVEEKMPEEDFEFGSLDQEESKEEDLDQLINDLLKEDAEEESDEEEGADDFSFDDEKFESPAELETSEAVEEEKDDFNLGDIFESDIKDTEQSLDDMLDGIETEEAAPEQVETEIPPAARASEKGGQKSILVVDDSVVIRKMVEIALENESYQINSVATGKEALTALDEKEPDLVILDIMLPDINGLDILKNIKSSRTLPVIMLSAKDTPRETNKARELGADDFIPKPFKDEELISKIHELIGE